MAQSTSIQDTKFLFYGGGSADTLTAASAGTRAAALALTDPVNRITTAAANASVALPQVVGPTGSWNLKGCPVRVINATSNAILVYSANGSSDTINGQASTASVSIPAGETFTFIGATGYPTSTSGNWYVTGAGAGSSGGTFSSITTTTGPNTLAGGTTLSGGLAEAVTVIAAAGATQGTATAIPATAITVQATTTTSSEGVKLPTAATSKQVTIVPPNTMGLKVYGGAAGQLINTGTTATTAYTMVSGKPVTFYGIDATHWRAFTASSLAATTITASGLITGSNGLTISAGLATLGAGLTLTGALIETVSTVSVAGASQGTATAIPAGAVTVNVTVTNGSAAGVKLPTVAAGRTVTVLADTAHSFKVYGGAAGQSINAGTTATTAVVVGTNKSATFVGISASKWKVRVA